MPDSLLPTLEAQPAHSPAWLAFDAAAVQPPALLPEHTLHQLVVVHRHGDRTPIASAVGNFTIAAADWRHLLPAASEASVWAEAFPVSVPEPGVEPGGSKPINGMLTGTGARQMHALGKSFRTWLDSQNASSLLEPRRLAVRSTNYRRTQQSVQNVLRGLLPDVHFPAKSISAVEIASGNMLLAQRADCERLQALPPFAPLQLCTRCCRECSARWAGRWPTPSARMRRVRCWRVLSPTLPNLACRRSRRASALRTHCSSFKSAAVSQMRPEIQKCRREMRKSLTETI